LCPPKNHPAKEKKTIVAVYPYHAPETSAVEILDQPAAHVQEPAPVDLAGLLDDVERFIRTYVVLTPDQSVLMTLWCAQSHARTAFDYAAYLNIYSPLPECGKSRTLEVLEALVYRPWMTGRVTSAVLARKVDAEHPVLLLDESDAAFNGDETYAEALRGLLNSGFHVSGKASCCVGQGSNMTYRDFSTFGLKAIAGIGQRLPSTVISRSIPIALKRRSRAERIAKWRRRDGWAQADTLRAGLTNTLRAATEALRCARPAFPEGLSDRCEDVLEPLISIADHAGGDWPQRAREAAVALMGHTARTGQETDQHFSLELLADIQIILKAHASAAELWTKTIIDDLVQLEDRPWATFSKGDKPINGNRLARLLKGFDVYPDDIRIGKEVRKGYRTDAFKDAFARYVGFNPLQGNKPNESGPETAKTEPRHEPAVADAKTSIPPDKHSLCCGVAVSTPDHEQKGDDDDQEKSICPSTETGADAKVKKGGGRSERI
jgi:hypothetical protein